MIALTEIELNEEKTREPIFYGNREHPIGMTRGDISRDVVIRLRIDDDRDIDRIHAAIANLVAPAKEDVPGSDARALPAY